MEDFNLLCTFRGACGRSGSATGAPLVRPKALNIRRACGRSKFSILAPKERTTASGRKRVRPDADETHKTNMKRILKRPLLNILENHAIAYPTPSNISYL